MWLEELSLFFSGGGGSVFLKAIQWNPINKTIFGPWKFGRINGVGSNHGAKCF